MTKILQNSSKDYLELRNYFAGRSVLSKAYSLSKQVCDAAEQTRASYMSIVYEKLSMFNDAGICALTSASDFSSEQLADKPSALFLKIPDEKDTRHNLAAIFILNIYKTLIKVASANEDLSLPRNVYFILDEFGNMPKIEKFDKMITVGRSRKIWFNMIIQSYAQLNNVYGDTVADIVKGNCGIKMFIGSNDMNTCKEYSELCGNITVVTTSSSGNINGNDVNLSSQTQVRPLIYPSELQRLNKPGDIGHSIIVTFGNYPLKTYFSPSFKVPFYVTGRMDTSGLEDRYFDENSILYNIVERNKIIFDRPEDTATGGKAVGSIKPKKIEVSSLEESENKPAPTDEKNVYFERIERIYKEFAINNPNATYEDFVNHLSKTISKGGPE
jgi:type IV secretion system protein VirD4